MSFIEAVILGIVEGVTEFLPISSTAHLMITSEIFNIAQSEFVKSFEIVIQLGAILAVIFTFGSDLLKNRILWKKILIAFLPTAIIGFILYRSIKIFLIGNFMIAILSLIIGGIVLIVIEKLFLKNKNPTITEIDEISDKHAFIIGIFQSLAVIPGVSRSAATIAPALLFNANRKTAAEFSFLLAIPTIGAAAGYDFIININVFNGNIWLLITGFVVSFISAYFSIKFFIAFIQKYSFTSFGIYRIIIAGLFFWFFLI